MREVRADPRLYAPWRGWCREVVQQVRFWPDHRAIQKELAAHLDDSRADLLRLGYDWKLADERVLKGMGDPVEIGRALDRAHKPALGWLWLASRWLVVLAMVCALWAVWWNSGLPDVKEWIEPSSTWEREYGYADNVPCPPTFQAGAYTMTVEHAYFDQGFLYIEMTAETPKFWLGPPELYDCLEAVDSHGVRYGKQNGPITGQSTFDGHIRHKLHIYGYDLAEDPAWIEIRHKTAGWSFRLDLSNGEEGAP